jgi:ferredoxin
MIKLKINNKEITVNQGTNVLEAAAIAGFHVPNICYMKELGHFNSCMICLVKDLNTGQLIPSCSLKAKEGMNIATDDAEIAESRKMALELMLSDHVGDCEAPCQIACPAHMNIPLMNRLLTNSKFDKALQIVKQDIALPSVLGLICPAPCEGACRRKTIDTAVSICLLKKFAGDNGKIEVQLPQIRPEKVAIIGAGPAGLAAAYYLRLNGIKSELFDKNPLAGGALRYSIDDNILPKNILDREITEILNKDIVFHSETTINVNDFKRMCNEYNAVIVATGEITPEMSEWGLDYKDKSIVVDKSSYQTNIKNVFAIGNANRVTKYAVRSVGQGKEVAFSIMQMFNNQNIIGEPRKFNSRFGKMLIEEFISFMAESVNNPRISPSEGKLKGYTASETISEAARCMHCDCRKADNCKLRDYSDIYNAQQTRFKDDNRQIVRKYLHHSLIYEPEKCIKCGLCVRITEKHKEKLGLTFIGRGFDVEISVPFNKEIDESLIETANLVCDNCPTGAISRKSVPQKTNDVILGSVSQESSSIS